MFFSVWSETCPVFSYFPYVFSYYFCNVGVVHSHTHTQTHSVAAVVAFACAVPPCGPALFRLFLRVFAFPFVSRNQNSLSSVRLSAMREKPRMPLAAVQRLASAARAFCRGTTLSGLRSQLAQERANGRTRTHAVRRAACTGVLVRAARPRAAAASVGLHAARAVPAAGRPMRRAARWPKDIPFLPSRVALGLKNLNAPCEDVLTRHAAMIYYKYALLLTSLSIPSPGLVSTTWSVRLDKNTPPKSRLLPLPAPSFPSPPITCAHELYFIF